MRLSLSVPGSVPPPYQRLGARLWRHGCAVWSPFVWLTDRMDLTYTVVAQAKLLIAVFARRLNDDDQLCDVLIGTATYTVGKSETTSLEICDHWHNACQVKLRLVVDGEDKPTGPVPDYMLLTQRQVAVESKAVPQKDYEDEFNEAQRSEGETQRLADAKPIMIDFDEMVRGTIKGPLGRSLPILEWLQHMTQESGRLKTQATYFTWLTNWYLKWQRVSFEEFCDNPQNYAEVLPFVCAHHVWTYAYCTDNCLEPNPTKAGHYLRACDTWATGRWIPSPLRGTDCEDNAADIVTTFRTLQQINPESIVFKVEGGVPSEQQLYAEIQAKHRRIAEALRRLSRQYTALLADTTLWMNKDREEEEEAQHKKDSGFVLHMYVKLVPTEHLHMLLDSHRHAIDRLGLPILTVDSTRRCWTPTRAMDSVETDTLKHLHTALRSILHDKCICDDCRGGKTTHDDCVCGVCTLIQTVGEYFSWGTPCDMWQTLASGIYHTDLRYYDVANGRVYMPQLPSGANTFVRELPQQKTIVFGVPALSLDGFLSVHGQMQKHLVPLDAYNLPTHGNTVTTNVFLTDITDVYLQQGQFGQRRPATTNASPARPVEALPVIAEHRSSDEKKTAEVIEDPNPLPPVPRIEFDFVLPHVTWQQPLVDHPRIDSISTIPVFVRPLDARVCTDRLHPKHRKEPSNDGSHHMYDVALLLEIMSITPPGKNPKHNQPFQRNLRVVRMERMYVQEPRQFVYVFYVTAPGPTPDPNPLESYLATTKRRQQ